MGDKASAKATMKRSGSFLVSLVSEGIFRIIRTSGNKIAKRIWISSDAEKLPQVVEVKGMRAVLEKKKIY